MYCMVSRPVVDHSYCQARPEPARYIVCLACNVGSDMFGLGGNQNNMALPVRHFFDFSLKQTSSSQVAFLIDKNTHLHVISMMISSNDVFSRCLTMFMCTIFIRLPQACYPAPTRRSLAKKTYENKLNHYNSKHNAQHSFDMCNYPECNIQRSLATFCI